jgi:hypothetical protein
MREVSQTSLSYRRRLGKKSEFDYKKSRFRYDGGILVPNYKYVVLTNALPGRETDFDNWCDNQHVRDVLKIPGIVGATRFRAASHQSGPAQAVLRYMTVYDIESNDLPGVIAELSARAGTAAMPISDSLDIASLYTGFYLAS